MKRLIALILSLLMFTSIFVSCKSTAEQTDVTPSQHICPDGMECTDFKGYEFRILTLGSLGGEHWAEYEFYYDADTAGNMLNEAVAARDSDVEALHNIEITYIEKTRIIDHARESLLAGNDEFDLLSLSFTGAASLAKEALLANLRDYEDILKLDEDHWDQRANYALDIKDHLYFAPSALTLNDKQATWAVYVNNSMLAEYPELTLGYEDGIFSMVERGDWTIEKMYNMVKAVSTDDGDGVRTNTDTYGHFGEGFSVQSLMTGLGVTGIQKDENGEFKFVLPDDLEQTAADNELIHEIVYNEENSILSAYLSKYVNDVWLEGPVPMLEENRLLFMITGVNRAKLYGGIKADLSIIPVPKADEQQSEYYNLMSGAANCIAVPLSSPDKERTCEILETLTYIADKTTYHAYKKSFLKSEYLSEEQNDKLFDLVFHSRVYDIGDIYSINGVHFGGSSSLAKADGIDDIESYLKKQKARNEKALEKFLLEMEEVFEKTKRYN